MPDAWTNKDERQYQHIKDSAEERGKSSAKAKEIAARTVNKQRRSEGRTPNRTTQGTDRAARLKRHAVAKAGAHFGSAAAVQA